MGEDQRPPVRFDEPPLHEMAISVHFSPMEGFQALHAGLLWQQLRGDYPLTREVPFAPQPIEQFGDAFLNSQVEQEIYFGAPPPDRRRYWFLSKDEVRIFQVQKDFVAANWRRVNGDERYPGYRESMLPTFERQWKLFCEFLEANGFARPAVRQVEVTYVSAVPRGDGWQEYGDLPQILAPWSGKFSGGHLPQPETAGVMATFLIPDHKGRLRVAANPWIRPRDKRETIQFTTIARIVAPTTDPSSVVELVNVAHDWAAWGFADFTTPYMHELWKRVT